MFVVVQKGEFWIHENNVHFRVLFIPAFYFVANYNERRGRYVKNIQGCSSVGPMNNSKVT